MKVADGITDSLRATALAKVQLVTGWYESNTQGIIEEACMQWAMAEERERKLLASLADADTVHTNILRGTIALTKAQAIHIAGLPADIEGRERVLRDALENTAELLNVAMERLGVCGEGDSGQRRADAEFPGGLAALHSARAALATPAPEQPNKPCSHCGHSNPHTSPAGGIADGCNEAGCYCAYYAPEQPAQPSAEKAGSK